MFWYVVLAILILAGVTLVESFKGINTVYEHRD